MGHGAGSAPARGRPSGTRRGGAVIRFRILQGASRSQARALLSVLAVIAALATGGDSLVSTIVPPPAWAQHEEPPAGGAGHGAADLATEAAGHKPSIMDVNPGLMVWTVVTFIALLVVLRFTAWKPLLASLDARERRIREAVEGAERARGESENLLARHRQMLEEAKEEAHHIIDEGKQDGIKLREEITAQARAEAEEVRRRSLREIELATDQAKKDLFVHASQLSVDLAERILRRTMDEADQRRLVDLVLEEYRAQQKPS